MDSKRKNSSAASSLEFLRISHRSGPPALPILPGRLEYMELLLLAAIMGALGDAVRS